MTISPREQPEWTVKTPQNLLLLDDSLWFKNAIIYEVPVKAFADSNADGIGDFPGLTSKLDYIQDLGVTALWLLPFFPSPLRDDGYDIADYTNVNPIYGTLADFQEFLAAAHERGIRTIIELIVNHTSDQHPWFQRSRRAPKGSSERDFYVWSDTPQKYQEARIIFQDFESSNWAWDSVAQAYYWHRFYSHQPDLNYDNPAVQEAVLSVLDFWLSMGVDGLRMDAVPYLYEREGTNCENLPETHAFLKQLRRHVDTKFPHRMLLAEANQWPEDAAQYYGEGDECHMNFHFPLMPRLFMSLRMEDDFPIIDILQQTPAIPDNCQWGLFLRNHDELTLEMVTDEDRDYMYRTYAQDLQMRLNLGIRRRLAPLLGNDRRQIELLHSLLLSLPGTPVLYYGDEIGMGDNVYLGDRNGVRTPMQWSPDRNAGFSRATPHRLFLPLIVESEYHYEAVNVEAQRGNLNSLWHAIKRLIATRKRFQALGRGSFEILHSDNRKVFTFTRTYDTEQILVVANLSRFVQTVQLDISPFQERVPIEIFGRTEFPPITESPYFLCLGPYAFYWFTLKLQPQAIAKPQAELPLLKVAGSWEQVFGQPELRTQLEAALADYLYGCHWFVGKGRRVQAAHLTELIPITTQEIPTWLAWLRVDYIEGESQTYFLALGCAIADLAAPWLNDAPQSALCRLQNQGGETALLYAASADSSFLAALLTAIQEQRRFAGQQGTLVASQIEPFATLASSGTHFNPMPLGEEQRNTSIIYGERFILKLFRKLEEGINPDLEIRRFLSEKHRLRHIVPLVGALEYRRLGAEPITLGVLQEFVPDVRNGWNYTLDSLRDYFDRLSIQPEDGRDVPVPQESLLALQQQELPELAIETIGPCLASARLLGQSTAELHCALASESENPQFTPESFSLFYQRSLYQSARTLTGQTMRVLAKRWQGLPPTTHSLAQTVLNRQEEIIWQYQPILEQKITALRIRCHGDYHLRQVLFTGKDFLIIDFEGDPNRTLSERRIKRSPLRDVAEMLQSFGYAAEIALQSEVENGTIRPENLPLMRQWTQFWERWVNASFLQGYLAIATQGSFLPPTELELQTLLNIYILERTVYSLGYELDYRPERVEICLRQLLRSLAVKLDDETPPI